MVIKALDPDWIRIRIGMQPKMLDQDPYQMYTDPKHWFKSAKPKELEKRELIKVSVRDGWELAKKLIEKRVRVTQSSEK